MAKRCSIRAQNIVMQMKTQAEKDRDMDKKEAEAIKQLSSLTPKRVRLMIASATARVSFRRVAIHDADAAAKERSEKHKRMKVASPGLIGALASMYDRPGVSVRMSVEIYVLLCVCV
jgi:hypothetical protein